MPNSAISSAPSSPRSSRCARHGRPARTRCRRPCLPAPSRSSAGWCSSTSSSTASASLSSASRARARSSSTMSSSKPSTAEQLADRHVGDFLDRAEAFRRPGCRRFPRRPRASPEQLARRRPARPPTSRRTWSCGHHVELPAGQPAGQAHVLAAAADRLRQLVLGDGEIHRMLFFVDDDRLHFGRRHRVDHELRRVVRPQHDVDALAVQLVGHRLHARTAHADAGADRIGAVCRRRARRSWRGRPDRARRP